MTITTDKTRPAVEVNAAADRTARTLNDALRLADDLREAVGFLDAHWRNDLPAVVPGESRDGVLFQLRVHCTDRQQLYRCAEVLAVGTKIGSACHRHVPYATLGGGHSAVFRRFGLVEIEAWCVDRTVPAQEGPR